MDKLDVILSREEREILMKIFEGRSNTEIANQLFLSKATVKRRVSDMLRKLELKNRVNLAVYYEHKFVHEKQA